MYTTLRLVRSKAATVRQRRCVVCWLCTSWNHDRPRQDNLDSLLQAGKHRCCSNNMQRWKERVNIADEPFLQASNSYKLVRSCAVLSACMMSSCLTFYLVVRLLRYKLLLQSMEDYAFASLCSSASTLLKIGCWCNTRHPLQVSRGVGTTLQGC